MRLNFSSKDTCVQISPPRDSHTGNPPVVVTGAGCVCAAGRSLEDSVASMFRGERNGSASDRIQTTHSRRYPVFEIPVGWMPDGYDESPQCLRCAGLAREATRHAIEDAGLDADQMASRRVGVCIGTTVGSEVGNEEFYRDFADGNCPDVTPIKDYLQADPADVVARRWGATGLRQTVNNACASGTVAIGQAAAWIRSGLCDIALAGGAEHLSRISYNGFAALQVMDAELCRPFDETRAGLNLGEGAGMVVLESGNVAAERGAIARAEIMGYGNSSDAYHASGPHPEGAGLGRAIDLALKEAGETPENVAFVNAHGTGTWRNDQAEGRLLSGRLPGVPFLSTKGYTGHTLGAAGGLEAVFTIAFLERGRMPASAGFSSPDPEFDANPVTQPTDVAGRIAVSGSIAFGGNNAALVIGRVFDG